MKKVILAFLLTALLSGCSVFGGFGANNGGAGVGIGTGINF
ncbi:lipoprotein [Bisgaard Taxon 10/6]|nr:lipoprotein [Exercitatus varius]MDG2960607.1 lipoprotein [Exercitatus varius]